MRRIPLWMGVCLAVGCGGKEPAAPASAPTADAAPAPSADVTPEDKAGGVAAAAPDSAPGPTDVAEAAPTPEPAEPAPDAFTGPVLAFVDGWVAAQNAGESDAYAANYAARFTGIKRAGSRTSSYDRKRWLADRKAMFKRAMKVEATEVHVLSAGQAGAVVTFTQIWESGSFRDTGPKQLVLTVEDGALRIAREEMLASNLSGSTDKIEPLAPELYLPVVASEGFTGIVLREVEEPKAFEHEAPEVVIRGVSAFARIGADAGAYVLYGAAGPVCEVSSSERGLFGHAKFHFGQRQMWDGELQPGDEPLSDAVVARETFEMAHGGQLEVLRVDAAKCAGALWARPLPLAASPTIYQASDSGAYSAKAMAETRKLPVWKALQKEYVAAAGPDGGPWDGAGGAQPAVRVFEAPDETRWVSVTLNAGSGCGFFGGEMWALWRVRGAEWTLMSDGETASDAWIPQGAIDLHGDGKPVFTDGETLVRPVGPTWRATSTVAPPYFDCPC